MERTGENGTSSFLHSTVSRLFQGYVKLYLLHVLVLSNLLVSDSKEYTIQWVWDGDGMGQCAASLISDRRPRPWKQPLGYFRPAHPWPARSDRSVGSTLEALRGDSDSCFLIHGRRPAEAERTQATAVDVDRDQRSAEWYNEVPLLFLRRTLLTRMAPCGLFFRSGGRGRSISTARSKPSPEK